MITKPLWRTKTFWAALGAALSGVGAYMTGEASLMEAAQFVFGGLIGMFLRQGMPK